MSVESIIRVTKLPVHGHKSSRFIAFFRITRLDFEKKQRYRTDVPQALAATDVLRPECRFYFLVVELAQL